MGYLYHLLRRRSKNNMILSLPQHIEQSHGLKKTDQRTSKRSKILILTVNAVLTVNLLPKATYYAPIRWELGLVLFLLTAKKAGTDTKRDAVFQMNVNPMELIRALDFRQTFGNWIKRRNPLHFISQSNSNLRACIARSTQRSSHAKNLINLTFHCHQFTPIGKGYVSRTAPISSLTTLMRLSRAETRPFCNLTWRFVMTPFKGKIMARPNMPTNADHPKRLRRHAIRRDYNKVNDDPLIQKHQANGDLKWRAIEKERSCNDLRNLHKT